MLGSDGYLMISVSHMSFQNLIGMLGRSIMNKGLQRKFWFQNLIGMLGRDSLGFILLFSHRFQNLIGMLGS